MFLQPVEHQRVGELAAQGLAMEVRPLRPGELHDLFFVRQQVVKLLRLAGEELLVLGVQH